MRGWHLFTTPPVSKLRQRGFGLLEAGLLLLLVGGAVMAGFVGLKARQASEEADLARTLMQQADERVLAFAAINDRLPCPDTTNDGLEDRAGGVCAAQKGRLPVKTLGLDGAGAERGAGRLLYVVQSNADINLANLADTYRPIAFNTAGSPPRSYNATRSYSSGTVLSTADLCFATNAARSMPVAAAHAQSGGVGLAYALVHPGQRDADGVAGSAGFDGLNAPAASAVAVELPSKTTSLGAYDDIVQVRSYAGLARALDCDRILDSLNHLSLATEVVEEVSEQKTSTRNSAIIASTINGVKSGVAALKVGLATKGLVKAGVQLGAAITALSAAIASCIVLVGCALIPTMAAAVAVSIASVAAFVATIALATASLASSLVATGLSISVAVQAGAEVNSSFNLSNVTADAQTAYNNAVTRKNTAQTNYNNLLAQFNATVAPARNAAMTAIENKVSGFANYVNGLNNCNPAVYTGDTNCSPVLSLATYQARINAVRDTGAEVARTDLIYRDADAAYLRSLNAANNPATNAPANSPLPAGARAELVNQLNAARAANDAEKIAGLEKAIEYFDSMASGQATTTDDQRVTNLAARINQLQSQIDQYTAQINALTVQIGGNTCSPLPTTEPLRQNCVDRSVLQEQRSKAQSLQAGLQDQLNQLGLTPALALTLRNTAQTNLTNATSNYNAAVNALNNGLGAMAYTVCVRKDKDGNVTSVAANVKSTVCTVYQYNAIASDLDIIQWKGIFIPTGVVKEFTVKVSDLYNTQYDYVTRERELTEALAALTKAQQDEVDALSTLNALSGVGAGGIQVWSGALDILERADKKGVVK